MKELMDEDTALPEGSIILDGRYRVAKLLHQRPRVNLYLGRRLSQTDGVSQAVEKHEPSVAIRELVLTNLPPPLRSRIEQAAFEEFVSPVVLGSPRLAEMGNRVYSEGERHYLVMQLDREHGEEAVSVGTLAELLRVEQAWPVWLNREAALAWGIQLCRVVARLHRLGVVLGNLNSAIVLVDRGGTADWAPILLVSWPPAPPFWPLSPAYPSASQDYTRIFPIATNYPTDVFAAPETLKGIGDERSDVYSLGALLYLLLTHYAPASAMLRHRRGSRQSPAHAEGRSPALLESLELIVPHLFDDRFPKVLENVLLRALAFDPARRYASAFALAEALEAVE